jgi:hypothetical protein
MPSENPRGCAVNPDGSLKDASDIDFVYSESEEPLAHPPLAAATTTLPPHSTRHDQLTQTRFNLANSNKRGGPALVISGVCQPGKCKANTTKASNQSRKLQKTVTTPNAATTSQRHGKRATVSDHDDDSSAYVSENSAGSSNDEDAVEDEVTTYERLWKEGELDRTVCCLLLISFIMLI